MTSRRDMLAGFAAAPWAILPGRARAQGFKADAAPPHIEVLSVGKSRLELQFAPGIDAALRDEARAWVRRSADAVAAYFGGFPVPAAELLMIPVDANGVRGGTTYALPSLLIRIRLGQHTTRAMFLADWIMVHEMVHLAIPRVPRTQNWLHEGIATYVEGVARGRAGLVDAVSVWREWARDMPKGQPQAGDAGLDHTSTWGRTYWGGAIFCLLADVKMLERSAGQAGLQQALQGVVAAGGSYAVDWPVARILATADAAVGQRTLSELYTRMKDTPAAADLDGLWRDLGVQGGRFDERAPLAAVRRAILA